MSRDLLISVSPGEAWAALREEGRVVELRVERLGAGSRVGELVLGRVVALRPELPAALVDIGLDRPAFLSAEDAEPGRGIAGLVEGQAVIIQVTKDARADKAAGVSLRPRLVGRHLDMTPGRTELAASRRLAPEARDRLMPALRAIAAPDEGFVLRPAAAEAEPADLAAEAAALRRRWQAIGDAARRLAPPARLEAGETPVPALLAAFAEPAPDAILLDDRAGFAEARQWLQQHRPALVERLRLGAAPLFEAEGVEEAVAAALAPRVVLPGGGALVIEATAAATMIDVDSGTRPGRPAEAGAAALVVNLAAAEGAARQVRLRNLSGPIIVDFIGMKRRGDRDRVLAAMTAALAADPAAPEVLGWTRLGHVELVRKRRHAPLAEILYERLPGGGLVKTPLTVALEALRAVEREAAAQGGHALALHLHPAVAAALDGPAREARHFLEGRLGRAVEIVAEPGRAREAFDIRPL